MYNPDLVVKFEAAKAGECSDEESASSSHSATSTSSSTADEGFLGSLDQQQKRTIMKHIVNLCCTKDYRTQLAAGSIVCNLSGTRDWVDLLVEIPKSIDIISTLLETASDQVTQE